MVCALKDCRSGSLPDGVGDSDNAVCSFLHMGFFTRSGHKSAVYIRGVYYEGIGSIEEPG